MRDTLQALDAEFAFQTSGRFDLLAGELTAEVSIPQLPDVERGLAIVLERRMRSAGVSAALQEVLEHQGLQLHRPLGGHRAARE